MIKWNLEIRKLSEIIPNEKNPRKISKRAAQELETSLRRFGLCEPLVLNQSGSLIGGHQRARTMRAIGLHDVAVYIPNKALSQKEEEELSIRLNKNTGDWDIDLLANHWDPEDLCNWGFTPEELSIDLNAIIGDTPDEEVEEAPTEPITKLGDLYQLDNHFLLCGDCRKADDVDKLLGSITVDMLCTDPPYGVDYAKKTESLKKFRPCKTTHKNIQSDVGENYRQFFSEFLSIIPWSDKNTSYICMLGQELHNLRLAMEDCEMKWGDYLVWVKNHLVLSRKDYNAKHEFVVYGWHGTHKFYGPTNSTTILEFDKPRSSKEHPTMKPIDLIRRLITDGSAPKANVYDPFCGSGTSLLCCDMKPYRNCYAMEVSPAYCDVIVNRWKKHREETGMSSQVRLNNKDVK